MTLLLSLATVASADTRDPVAPQTVNVPAGTFVAGSSRAERETAYLLDETAYGHRITREQRWYESEGEVRRIKIGAYSIMKNLVTNADYALFVADTGHRSPDVTPEVWDGYGLIHPFARTRRHAWSEQAPPAGREHHPVVMVSLGDARAYASWLSRKTATRWRLPTQEQWEKAARGVDGRWFPWGNTYDPQRLNSHDQGPFDTTPVGQFPSGSSPFGMNDPAGQVFEWTRSPSGPDRHTVKGGSWDDKGCGVCRPAAKHGRPTDIKHILIGFRLVKDTATNE